MNKSITMNDAINAIGKSKSFNEGLKWSIRKWQQISKGNEETYPHDFWCGLCIVADNNIDTMMPIKGNAKYWCAARDVFCPFAEISKSCEKLVPEDETKKPEWSAVEVLKVLKSEKLKSNIKDLTERLEKAIE